MIPILQPASLLVASYAITEKELLAIQEQAKKAWPDIQDEEVFNGELKEFMDNGNPLPFFQKEDGSYYFRLAQHASEPIWFYKAKSFNEDSDFINVRSTKQGVYSRFIPKAIIIRKSLMDRKGLAVNSELNLWKDYYGLLKNLFLEEEGLFLNVISLIKSGEKLDSVKVCVLKDQRDDLEQQKRFKYVFYTANIPYSVIGTFLLHKLAKKINDERSQIDLISRPKIQSANRTKEDQSLSDLINNINKDFVELDKKIKINENKNKNSVNYFYYAIPTIIVISLLIFLSKNYFVKHLEKF
ncbi:MAG TPA: hypothetical protein VL201_03745 [Patescibacteria group bacterium]|jgi:hypothetical protein|nr:hypothetical protein [Patescibacteria group bacterium]